MPWIEFETSRGLRPFTWNRDVSSKDKHLPNTHHTRYSIHAWKHGRFEYMEWGSEAGITKDASEIWQLLYMKRPISTHTTSESGAITRHIQKLIQKRPISAHNIRERGNYRTHTKTNSEIEYTTLIVPKWAGDKVWPKGVQLEISNIYFKLYVWTETCLQSFLTIQTSRNELHWTSSCTESS